MNIDKVSFNTKYPNREIIKPNMCGYAGTAYK